MIFRILALALLPSLALAQPATGGLKILLVEDGEALKNSKGLAKQLQAAGPLQVRAVSPGKLSEDDIVWARTFMITAALTKKDEAWVLGAGPPGLPQDPASRFPQP